MTCWVLLTANSICLPELTDTRATVPPCQIRATQRLNATILNLGGCLSNSTNSQTSAPFYARTRRQHYVPVGLSQGLRGPQVAYTHERVGRLVSHNIMLEDP